MSPHPFHLASCHSSLRSSGIPALSNTAVLLMCSYLALCTSQLATTPLRSPSTPSPLLCRSQALGPLICTQRLATTPTRHVLTTNTDNSGSHAHPWAPTLTTTSISGLLPPPSPTTSRTDLLDPTPSSPLIVVNIYENLTIVLAPSPADNTPTATAPASDAVTQPSQPWWESGPWAAAFMVIAVLSLAVMV
jgi:hypothetical protein